ncbi:MAG: sigma-54-dependent transcriptional regulator [Pontibacterium sp.]
MSHILIVEDEHIIRSALRKLLEKNGYTVQDSESVDDAIERFELNTFDLIISDLRLPGLPGTEIIKRAETVPVLIMTSYASMRSAVEAMKLGAADYVAKPFNHDEMLATVKTVIEKHKTQASTKAPASVADDSDQPSKSATSKVNIIGNSQPMQELFRRIGKVAKTEATVLIQGESGTGKELAARAIHEQSGRAGAPMICVNCAAIPETLIESELFGHEKGAFTGANAARNGLIEAAHGGTLFLDEIGELPLEAQARLLRFLQEGEIRRVGAVSPKQVDVRLIAATHRDLRALARNGDFREDLYYRLYVMELRMPPLRERGDDILLIANKFLTLASEKLASAPMRFSQGALETMRRYRWPGNVRELENAIERASIMADNAIIDTGLLGLDLEHTSLADYEESFANQPHIGPRDNISPPNRPQAQAPEAENLSLDDYFVRFVLDHQSQMNETELAKKLGISRKSLWERRQKLGIPRKAKKG